MRLSFAIAPILSMAIALCADAEATTVIYQGKTVELNSTLPDANDLWVTPTDMTQVTGFVLKPEGLCRDEMCIPLRQTEDNDSFVKRKGQAWLSLTEFARKAQQAYAHDEASDVWAFGEFPLERDSFLNSGMAPDFALKDRKGKTIKLSDFRGKKVLLVTWASWCGCRLDVPSWQPIYEEFKDKNFEIISIAEDTGGEAKAGPIFDAAKVTFTTLIDTKHVVSLLYNFVNVPSAAWIDEEGRIVRINEGTYAAKHKIGNTEIGRDDYAPAVRDWAINGAKSKYVWSAKQVAERIRTKTSDEAKAEAVFALGTYFYENKDVAKADMYWKQAQMLFPDSWNMHRQDWQLAEPENASAKYGAKRGALTKSYYRDLELQK